MGELKCKMKNPFEFLAEGVGAIMETGRNAYAKVKDVIDESKVLQASLSVSSINILVASDPTLASCKNVINLQREMFPIKKGGYYIDYKNPYNELCPHHKCRTFRVKDTRGLVWCPLCMRFLCVYE